MITASVSLIYQPYCRRFIWLGSLHFQWNVFLTLYVAALDAGTAVGLILVFFWSVSVSFLVTTVCSNCTTSLEYPLNGTLGHRTIQSWWGNTVHKQTSDWNNAALRLVKSGDTFG